MKQYKWSSTWLLMWLRRMQPRRLFLLVVLLFGIIAGAYTFCNREIQPHGNFLTAQIAVQATATVGDEDPELQVSKQMLTIAQQVLSSGRVIEPQSMSLSDIIWQICVGVLPDNGYFHCLSGIPILQGAQPRITKIVAQEEAYYASALISDIWKHQFEKVSELTLSKEVQVILYHTHNAETYLPDAGVSKVSGQNGGVVQAGKVLQEALQKKYGIRTAHSTTIHDYPDWSRSYQNSLLTAQQLLHAYPSTKMVFDIHRDAGFTSKKTTTTLVHGKSAAKIMLVIGCNHSNWKKNLAFARLLEAKCNELYPGLLRENIRMKETGRYNQQVDDHAVLLEIGSDLNTQAEAEYSMECFAHVVYEVLNELES